MDSTINTTNNMTTIIENSDNPYAITMNLTCRINNDMEKFIVRSVQEYGMSYNLTVNPKKIYEAIKKQTPKKPIGDLHSVPHYRCPNCHSGVVMYEDSTKFPYCHHCGQALDW